MERRNKLYLISLLFVLINAFAILPLSAQKKTRTVEVKGVVVDEVGDATRGIGFCEE